MDVDIDMEVSWVIGVPLVIIHFQMGFPIINPPFWGTPISGNLHIDIEIDTNI